MKLFFDARFIRTDFHDGISRYSWSLANNLYALDPSVTFMIQDKAQLNLLPKGVNYIMFSEYESPKELLSGYNLAKFKPDVVFSPMQLLRPHKSYKLILTVHDLIYYHHATPPPQVRLWAQIGWRLYHLSYWPQRLALHGAAHVAVVSKNTKHDVIQAKLTKKPISVVYNAPNDLTQHVKKVVNKKVENLVYMGSFMPYKNVETLIAGMNYLPGRTLHLLSRITPQRKRQLEKLVPTNAKVIFHNGVSDEQYAKVLANNAALVSASRDEGFGLPIAEAMNLGVPVVLSDIPAHREVAAQAGTFFDVNLPAKFAAAVKVLDNDKKRQNLVKLGKMQVKQFDWAKSAQTILDIARGLYEKA
ncbi:glycosyltransferase family 4 protein [Candidatus Saccharibacteria bacterium]|nr:glycosyltransferase family 4 protein [Candidatus Saccharibacteria bacterium]